MTLPFSVGGCTWKLKSVSNPWLRQNVARMDRIPFDLFAQLSYHHSQVFGFASMIRSPHRLQEPFMSERLAVMNRQHAKHFELFRGEVNALPADLENSSFEIYGQFRMFDSRMGLLRARPAKRRANTRQKFSHREWLDDIVVGPRIKSEDFVVFGIPDGHHDDGTVEGTPQPVAGFETTDTRQIHIKQNQAWTFPQDGVDSLLAALGFHDFIAVARESRAEDTANLRFVVDYKNRRIVHVCASPVRVAGKRDT